MRALSLLLAALLAALAIAGCSSEPSAEEIQKQFDARKKYVKEHPELGD